MEEVRYNYKLFTLLQGISSKEMKHLRKMVVSPYYLRHAKTIDLFDFLEPFHPDFNSPELSRENIYAQLYPNVPFNSQRLRDVMFFLLEVVEHFLVNKYLKEHAIEYRQILIRQLQKQRMFTYLTDELKTTQRLIDKMLGGETRLWATAFIEKQIFTLNETTSDLPAINTNAYRAVLENWLKWLQVKLLEQAAIIAEDENLYTNSPLPQLITLLNQKLSKSTDIEIEAFQKVFNLKTQKQSDDYEALKTFVVENLHLLENKLKYYCVQYLFEYLNIRAFDAKNSILLSDDYFRWKQMLRDMEIEIWGSISAPNFYNEFIEYIKRNQLEEAEAYIHKYMHLLPSGSSKKNFTNFIWANLYYSRKEFDKCIDCLNHTDLKALGFLRFQYKQLMILVFFEKNEFDFVAYQLDSFRHYIKGKSLRKELYRAYSNFHHTVARILKLYTGNYSRKKITSFKHKLKTNPPPALAKWAFSKIDVLLERTKW